MSLPTCRMMQVMADQLFGVAGQDSDLISGSRPDLLCRLSAVLQGSRCCMPKASFNGMVGGTMAGPRQGLVTAQALHSSRRIIANDALT